MSPGLSWSKRTRCSSRRAARWTERGTIFGAIAALCASAFGCAENAGASRRLVEIDRSDRPLTSAREEELRQFNRGDALFEVAFREPDGLGPLYIRSSCVSCHQADGRGPGLVTRLSVEADPQQKDNAHALPFGDVARPYVTKGAQTPLVAEGAVRESHRFPPAVFGRGHMEAVADSEIERLAREAATRRGPIRGRIHRVSYQSEGNPDRRYHQWEKGQPNLIGRFGLKARIASLDEFTADALQGDMGITSPLRPMEPPNPDHAEDDQKQGIDVDSEVVNALADYVRLLQLPERKAADQRGQRAFQESQCATCHVPELATRVDYPIAELAATRVSVYTDFLLHDMGEGLDDGVQEGDASGREWRTAPLIGLRFFSAYLHDGRARTIEDAILLHRGPGSEANESIEAYQRLSESDRRALLEFVRQL